jgi:hypothetical protein
MQHGDSVALRVTTYKGKQPIWEYAPEGLKVVKLKERVSSSQAEMPAGQHSDTSIASQAVPNCLLCSCAGPSVYAGLCPPLPPCQVKMNDNTNADGVGAEFVDFRRKKL